MTAGKGAPGEERSAAVALPVPASVVSAVSAVEETEAEAEGTEGVKEVEVVVALRVEVVPVVLAVGPLAGRSLQDRHPIHA